MDVRSLQQANIAVALCGYLPLLIAEIRSKSWTICPLFCCWLAGAIAYYLIWDPYKVLLVVVAESILFTLRFTAALEAFILATPLADHRERRLLLSICLLVAVVGIGLLLLYPTQGPTPLIYAYRSVRQKANVGLGMASLFAVVGLWLQPVHTTPRARRHGLAVAILMLLFGITSAMPAEWTARGWTFSGAALVWAWLKLRFGLFMPCWRQPTPDVRNCIP